jgi:hypothetical protein
MTKQQRFPYEESRWGGNDNEVKRRWHEVLERTGPENVRARLAQTNAGSGVLSRSGPRISSQ